MADKAFPRDTHLTSIAIAYKNPDVSLVADGVLPRVQVNKKTFGYIEYPLAEMYSVPDTRVGEYSRINQSSVGGKRLTAECEDFGQEIPLSDDDISQAPQGTDPKERATERATNIILIDREKRTADLVFNPANYLAEVKTTVDALARWSLDTINPIPVILAGLDAAFIRPNVLLFGQSAWRALATNPFIVSACLGNSGVNGVASRERVAELFEVSEVLVGASRINSVKPGKAPVLSRMWGKHLLAFYRDRTVDTSGGVTFGITAQYGQRIAGTKDLDIGLRGGIGVRSGETVKELIVANRACYFFENVCA